MRDTRCNANHLEPKRALSQFMTRKTKVHWDNHYHQKDTSIWDDIETETDWWEVLTEYMEEKDIEQLARELPNSQSQVGQVQINSEDATGDTTERLHVTTTEGQPTAAQALETDLDNRKEPTAGIEMKPHETGTKENKDEVQPMSTGGK